MTRERIETLAAYIDQGSKPWCGEAAAALRELLAERERAERWKDLACSAPDAFHVQWEHAPGWMKRWEEATAAEREGKP